MAITIKSRKNLMNYVPVKSRSVEYSTTPEGLVQIYIPRNGRLDRLVRIFKKTPSVFTVDLDKFGTTTWELIDGTRTIYDIGVALKKQFGDDIEPVYVRTGQFMNLLKNNKLVSFIK